jgi:hypothetical protein
MTAWQELQKNHPAIEPRPVSTMEKSALAGNEDMVNHPAHYQGDIECIDAIEASMSKEAFAGHCKACVIKYLWRYQQKGGVESLQKAQWYLSRLISTEKNAL